MEEIVLASASPRRRELLKLAGIPFRALPARGGESYPPNLAPEEVVQLLAVRKAEEVAAMPEASGKLVLGADTVVAESGRILGKPVSPGQAEEMLAQLSGKTHTVLTGVCLLYKGSRRVFAERTEVEFYPLTREEIARYVATGEPLDKAGAYGIQGRGCLLVKGIRGDYCNVVGLPVAKIKRILEGLI